MIVVAVAGYFDPLHPGHESHIYEASKLGDRLIIITHPDYIVAQKRIRLFGKPIVYQNLKERLERIKAIPWVWDAIVSIDTDGSVVKTLKLLRPNIFAKGGDRTPDNMPASEVEVCRKIGCQIIYGVGESKRPEWSSSQIALAASGVLKGGKNYG